MKSGHLSMAAPPEKLNMKHVCSRHTDYGNTTAFELLDQFELVPAEMVSILIRKTYEPAANPETLTLAAIWR